MSNKAKGITCFSILGLIIFSIVASAIGFVPALFSFGSAILITGLLVGGIYYLLID